MGREESTHSVAGLPRGNGSPAFLMEKSAIHQSSPRRASLWCGRSCGPGGDEFYRGAFTDLVDEMNGVARDGPCEQVLHRRVVPVAVVMYVPP